MSASIGSLIPPLRPYCRALLDVANRAGLQPRITSTRRSHQEQAQLYRAYQSGSRKYPVAPPGQSAHEYGYAFDMVTATMDPVDFADLGKVWQDWGGIWGGDLNDPIHFEYPGFHQPSRSITYSRSHPPPEGGRIVKLANWLSSFIPGVGEAQLIDTLVSALDGNDDLAGWYLQHPASALRDLLKYFFVTR